MGQMNTHRLMSQIGLDHQAKGREIHQTHPDGSLTQIVKSGRGS